MIKITKFITFLVPGVALAWANWWIFTGRNMFHWMNVSFDRGMILFFEVFIFWAICEAYYHVNKGSSGRRDW